MDVIKSFVALTLITPTTNYRRNREFGLHTKYSSEWNIPDASAATTHFRNISGVMGAFLKSGGMGVRGEAEFQVFMALYGPITCNMR